MRRTSRSEAEAERRALDQFEDEKESEQQAGCTRAKAEAKAAELTETIGAWMDYKVKKSRGEVAYFAHDLDERAAVEHAILKLLGFEPRISQQD